MKEEPVLHNSKSKYYYALVVFMLLFMCCALVEGALYLVI